MKKRFKQTLITGRKPIIEALEAGTSIERIFVARSASGDSMDELFRQAHIFQVPVHKVPEEKLNRLHPARRNNRGNDQGCIAIVSKITYLDLQEVISFVVERGEVPLFLVVDGVTDIKNIGAMARSALICGVQALILPDRGVASLNEEAIKSSAGALEHLMVCRVSNWKKAFSTLRLNGFKILTSSLQAEKLLEQCDWTGPSAVVLGSEEKGVQSSLIKDSDVLFKIPMQGNFDSFNVSVATGIILYEAMKQRM